jgi:hypothetical protein
VDFLITKDGGGEVTEPGRILREGELDVRVPVAVCCVATVSRCMHACRLNLVPSWINMKCASMTTTSASRVDSLHAHRLSDSSTVQSTGQAAVGREGILGAGLTWLLPKG